MLNDEILNKFKFRSFKFVYFSNFSRKCLKYKGNFQFLNFEY
nr:MAG TPA: hypothetical protein [Caudoviricetes sp.]